MNICFFTMANNGYYNIARDLIISGEKVKRPIWFYRIPPGTDPHRYKIELLKGDILPKADKYVYLDADFLMLRHGKWESVVGGKEVRPRTHMMPYASEESKQIVSSFYSSLKMPEVNTGCLVLPAHMRKAVGSLWYDWCLFIDSHLEKKSRTRDQFQFRPVREWFEIPALPPEYVCLNAKEKVTPEHVTLHFAALPRGLEQYNEVRSGIFNYPLQLLKHENRSHHIRGDVLIDLIVKFAENTALPVGAEVGVAKGKTTNRLLGAFPGMKLYCIDPWVDEHRRPFASHYKQYERIKSKYPDRIIEQKCRSLDAKVDEKLDFVFIDADHAAKSVEEDIRFWYPKLKNGGIMVGHDIDFRGSYYNAQAVRQGVEAVFGKSFGTGPACTWWRVKDGRAL